jgi:hypothetical protein
MSAAAHASGAPAGYAWLVFGQGQQVHEPLRARRLPASAHRNPIGHGMADNAGDPTTVQ